METNIKVIFLDNDGVICLPQQWGSRKKKIEKWKRHNKFEELPLYCRFDHFDDKAVKVLNEILEKTGAEIVVSSDWRKYANLEELKNYYTTYNIKEPLDVTPLIEEFDSDLAGLCAWKGWTAQARSTEIKLWLSRHPEVKSWVAIDDLDMRRQPEARGDSEWGLENFILTRENEGIKQSGLKNKVINILNEKD